MLKQALLASVLFCLAACGQSSAPVDTSAQPPAEAGAVEFGSTRNMPDWLFILRTNDGGMIHFNQRTVTRADGMADIWLQVRHGRQQLFATETDTHETVVRYEVERLHYRFNCQDNTFVVIERQIMGANEQVIARDEPTQIYRATPQGGAAAHVLPIACRGG